MSRTLKLSFICFYVFILIPKVQAEVNLTKLVESIRPAIVTIITYDVDNKSLSQGTGFFINEKGHLITNYHVLKEANSAEIITYDGKHYPIKLVVGEEKNLDLIKASVDLWPEQSVRWLKVNKNLPSIAERVLVVGSPLGLDQTVSDGIISAVRDIPNMGKIFQITAPISKGSSGSPVVNLKGEVLGVASFGIVQGQNLNFAIPGKYVLDIETDKNLKLSQFQSAKHIDESPEYKSISSEPKVISHNERYIRHYNGVVEDTKTGLEWYAGPDKDTSWHEAITWVKSLTIAGGGWQMPVKEELRTLYKKETGTRNMTWLLKTSGWFVWSGEINDSMLGGHFDFSEGKVHWDHRNYSHYYRCFAVRSRK